jgi:hypothetical protein
MKMKDPFLFLPTDKLEFIKIKNIWASRDIIKEMKR